MKRMRMIGLSGLAVFAVAAVAAASATAEANPCGLISKAAIAKAFKFTHVYEERGAPERSSTGAVGACYIEVWQGNPAKPPSGKRALKRFFKEVGSKLSKGVAAHVAINVSYGEFTPGEWKPRSERYLPTFTILEGEHFGPPTGGAEFATAGVRSSTQGTLLASGVWWTTALPGSLELEVSESKKRQPRADFDRLAASIAPAFERVLTARSW